MKGQGTGHANRRRSVAVVALLVSVLFALSVSSTAMEMGLKPSLSANPLPNSSSGKTAIQKKMAAIQAAHGKAGAPRAAGPVATTNSLTIAVESSRDSAAPAGPRKGAKVGKFKWLINLDNTGDPHQVSPTTTLGADVCHPLTPTNPNGNANFPTGCNWPSIHQEEASPVISTGDQSDWNDGKPLPAFDGVRGIAPGKYLVSVLSDGYELGGQHFTVPSPVPGVVNVKLNPYPVPLGTIRVKACVDMAPTNSKCDLPEEPGVPTQKGAAPADNFRVKLTDFDGVVSVDYFGNPLCTEYKKNGAGKIILDARGNPTPVPGTGGACITDVNGDVAISNMAPNRYSVQVMPPDNQQWVLTSTLEGNKDFDVWLVPNDTGYDSEMVLGGEPVPFVDFAFVKPIQLPPPPPGQPAPTGEIKGQVVGGIPYIPGQNALAGVGMSSGQAGFKIDSKPVKHAWVALSDMAEGDFTVYAQPADPVTGAFDVKGLPDSLYSVAAWDEPMDYRFDLFNVTIVGGQVVDVGQVPLVGWFTRISGHVFIDRNGNGRMDPGEQGVPNLPVQNLNRTNNAYEQGQNVSRTDFSGYYELTEAYPLGQFTVNQAFFTRYKTTGVTWQACNDPQEHTLVTGLVDVSFLPIIGQCGRLDWAIQPYDAASGDNGIIVATVFYDSVRLKYNGRQAQTMDHQVGIPGVTMEQYTPVKNAQGNYVKNPDGSYATKEPLGAPLLSYLTENYHRPTDCVVRDANGTPFNNQDAIAQPTATYHPDCIEAGMAGVQFGVGVDNPAIHGPQTVDGNYTLGIPGPKGLGDWLVKMNVPTDTVLPPVGGKNRPLYKTTTENDVGTYDGGQYVPQGADVSGLAWPAQAGPPNQMPTSANPYPENPGTYAPNPDPICAGATFTVKVTNPNFLANGGSPFEGKTRNTCDVKLLHQAAGQAIAPNFHVWTDVPIATKFSGYIVDDVSVSSDRRSTTQGEVQGIANSPVGIYDWTGREVHSVDSDYNGQWEVLMPSSDTRTCPTPAKLCPQVYRFVGNDPGQPGAPHTNFNPQYRTISANFHAWPGMFMPADLAPTKMAISLEAPPGQFLKAPVCEQPVTQPQIWAVDKPYITGTATQQLTINGIGFGAATGTVFMDEDGDPVNLAVSSWSDRSITATVDPSVLAGGPHQLVVATAPTATSPSLNTINGLTYHVIKNPYLPTVVEVGPTKTFKKVQAAVEEAAKHPQALVVVYPNTPSQFTPLGTYYENVIMHGSVKLQGVGPGGVYPDGSGDIQGSIIDGRYWWWAISQTQNGGLDTNEPYSQAWLDLLTSLTYDGPHDTYVGGQDIFVVAKKNEFQPSFAPAVDGFTLSGGDQLLFPENFNEFSGHKQPLKEQPLDQGGAVMLNAYADHFRITNNVIKQNSGSYGTIRVGTPYIDAANTDVHISNNQIFADGGTNFAGAIGMFQGSDNYRIDHNEMCGNVSAEYGGAISHFGFSPGGKIDHNKIYLNHSIDEGGGITIAGELPMGIIPGNTEPLPVRNPIALTGLAPGSGAVRISENYIGANVANDDGGGIRLLMVNDYPIDIVNNMITNNVSAHEGGGIAIDDAPDVRIVNNTIAKNITTATAVTSNGAPAAAGISSARNSSPLQKTLPAGADKWSNPLLFNDIFWDNRAGSWTSQGVKGIGLAGDLTPINLWDIGTQDQSGKMAPTYSILNSDPNSATQGFIMGSGDQLNTNPLFVAPYDLKLDIAQWRSYFRFRPSAIVGIDLPANVLGNYHLQGTSSPAADTGTAASGTSFHAAAVPVSTIDIDDSPRPCCPGDGIEIGAHELPEGAPGGGGGAGGNAGRPAQGGGGAANVQQHGNTGGTGNGAAHGRATAAQTPQGPTSQGVATFSGTKGTKSHGKGRPGTAHFGVPQEPGARATGGGRAPQLDGVRLAVSGAGAVVLIAIGTGFIIMWRVTTRRRRRTHA
jgi:hypothetical protein